MNIRFFSLLLCLSLLLGLASPVFSADMEVQSGHRQPDPEELLEVTLRIHSNLSSWSELDGLYFDNVFYIDYTAVCELTGSWIYSQDASQVHFSLHGGLREILVTDQCTLTESSYSRMDIPTACWNGKLYMSAPHILRHMGADVDFAVDADAAVHMRVSMPYTILDLCRDYQDANGYRFSWSEAEGKLLDPEKLQTLAAIDTIFFGYDSHLVIQGLFPKYNELVMEELYRDVLIQILLTNAGGLVETEDACLTLLGGVSGELLAGDAWINTVLEVAKFEGSDALIADILAKGEHVQLTDAAGAAKTFIKITGSMANALQTVIQYSSINSGQKDVLKNSLNRVSKSHSFYANAPDIFDAAQTAQAMLEDQQLLIEREAKKILFNTAVDAISGMIPIVSTISSATETMTTVVQTIPALDALISAEANITTASVASTVSSLGDNLMKPYVNTITYAPTQTDAQTYARANMLLSLKASLLARLELIESGMLTETSKEAMQRQAKATARLLNKAENAQCFELPRTNVTEDLTWIQKLAGKGSIGMNVISGQYIYYWQYHSDSFQEGSYMGSFSASYPATLVRRDAEGNELALFDATAGAFVVTATRVFYTNDGIVCSRNTDGSGYTEWCSGNILDVDSYGNFLICRAEDNCFSLNTWTGETTVLFSGGRFLDLYMGVVYYEGDLAPNGHSDPEYKNSTRGKVTLHSVNLDGSNNHLMVTTAPDLYDGGTPGGSTDIQRLHFGKEGLYFSYGNIAGTGSFFQGGKIMFVSYDGSRSEILAGQTELVDANFGVLEDGSITTTADQYFLFYDSSDNYCVNKGYLYWMDPVTGLSRALISEETLASGAATDGCFVGSCNVWGEQAIIMVHYTTRDPSQDFGWREYSKRTTSITYLLDLESGTMTPLYSF